MTIQTSPAEGTPRFVNYMTATIHATATCSVRFESNAELDEAGLTKWLTLPRVKVCGRCLKGVSA